MDSRTSSNIKGPTVVLSEETTKSELKIIRFDPTMINKNISIVATSHFIFTCHNISVQTFVHVSK